MDRTHNIVCNFRCFQVQLLVFVGGQAPHHSNVYNAQRYAPTALHVTISVKGLIIHHGNSESLHGVFAPTFPNTAIRDVQCRRLVAPRSRTIPEQGGAPPSVGMDDVRS